jgi:hypothetical protein
VTTTGMTEAEMRIYENHAMCRTCQALLFEPERKDDA